MNELYFVLPVSFAIEVLFRFPEQNVQNTLNNEADIQPNNEVINTFKLQVLSNLMLQVIGPTCKLQRK